MPGESSDAALEFWSSYVNGRDEYVAPPILYVETLSAIRSLTHRGLLTDKEGKGIVEDFLGVGIRTAEPSGLYGLSYSLASRYRQPRAYDSCYLALAELLSCPLLTLDKRLYNTVAGDFPLIRLVP